MAARRIALGGKSEGRHDAAAAHAARFVHVCGGSAGLQLGAAIHGLSECLSGGASGSRCGLATRALSGSGSFGPTSAAPIGARVAATGDRADACPPYPGPGAGRPANLVKHRK